MTNEDNTSEISTPTPALQALFQAAVELAAAAGTHQVGPEHLFLVWHNNPGVFPAEPLRAMGFDPVAILTTLSAHIQASGDLRTDES
ncbi:Clp protease N-terminal domain-containing protein [Nocardia otitidiscaviarum]|uniref:Clp protease N-terminal domain-containing protein n=1 Tax=Nocardia otitidiscaviarum TaxID=1823 RepID=UPI002453FB68|nr:Clp protease N-terminal domain-containing protein [Nocardia otitidiscaviarum]